MKILCLYNNPCAIELFNWLSEGRNDTVLWSDRLDASWCLYQNFDLTVSYTYRYILTEDVINALGNNAVNIHNSFLPFNRGSDPNIWSILDGTPRGVTLHYIDSKVDHGAIIVQTIVPIRVGDTLKTSYDALDSAAKALFRTAFAYYPFWREMAKQSLGSGTYHAVADGCRLREKIVSYDVKACEFRDDYLKHKQSVSEQYGGVIQRKGTVKNKASHVLSIMAPQHFRKEVYAA